MLTFNEIIGKNLTLNCHNWLKTFVLNLHIIDAMIFLKKTLHCATLLVSSLKFSILKKLFRFYLKKFYLVLLLIFLTENFCFKNIQNFKSCLLKMCSDLLVLAIKIQKFKTIVPQQHVICLGPDQKKNNDKK